MNDYTLGFKTGLAFGCATSGVSATTLRKSAACTDACMAAPAVQVQLAKIASTICTNAGPGFEKTAALYDTIVRRNGVESKLSQELYLEPVVCTLANLEKSAGIISDLVNAPIRVAGAGADAVYKSAILSAIAGAGIGTLGWSLFRDVKEDDATAEAKLEQAKMYRRIAGDLQKRLDAQAETSKDTKKLRKQIEEESDSGYVL